MSVKEKEAFEAVEKINEEIFKKYEKLNNNDNYNDWLSLMPIVSITFASPYMFIGLTLTGKKCNLPDYEIYNCLNDERIYYEKSDKYETFYKFIKRKFRLIKDEINSIKL